MRKSKKAMKYPAEIEEQMIRFYKTLSEKEQRRYMGLESLKLGEGSKKYIYELFGSDYHRLQKGLKELYSDEALEQKEIRKKGGGRKKAVDKLPGLEDIFLEVVKDNTAGSPMDENIKWTNLSQERIVELLAQRGFFVSVPVVKDLLKKHHFKKRKPFKSIAGGKSEFRDEQFQKIDRLKEEYQEQGNPVVSMDVKKKN